MKLENQVCSLELSKKMRELGFEQESAFYWRNAGQVGWQIENEVWMRNKKEDAYSAYTVAELGEFLKKVNFEKSKIKTLPEEFCPRTEDESLKATFDQNFWAKMLIYLKEQELI